MACAMRLRNLDSSARTRSIYRWPKSDVPCDAMPCCVLSFEHTDDARVDVDARGRTDSGLR